MVYLVLTEEGWYDLLNTDVRDAAIWLGANVLSPVDVKRYRDKGFNLSVFSCTVQADDPMQIGPAIETISEHHGGKSIWVEFPSAK